MRIGEAVAAAVLPGSGPVEPVPGGWPESARVAAIAALDKRAMLGALDISVGDAWLLVTDILNAVALPIAAAVLRNWGAGQQEVQDQARAAERWWLASHEHAWTRCEQCKVTGPCACAGGVCCPGERRENEARAEGSAAERERCAMLAERAGATYFAPLPGSGVTASTTVVVGPGLPAPPVLPFADLLRESP
jgi:hypothetical protein